MPEDDVETLLLPLSGLRYQRRHDGYWRCVSPGQYDAEQTGAFEPDPDEWVPGDLPVADGGRAQWAPGSHDGMSWWLLYGDNRTGRVTVTLSDGQPQPIRMFGLLWICEWVSEWQPVVVSIGDESHKAFHRIPGYSRARDRDD